MVGADDVAAVTVKAKVIPAETPTTASVLEEARWCAPQPLRFHAVGPL